MPMISGHSGKYLHLPTFADQRQRINTLQETIEYPAAMPVYFKHIAY